jgi:hypothetical protein
MFRKVVSAIAVSAVILAGMVAIQTIQSAPAHAADASQFNPGNLISDANFFNGAAMGAGDVQAFIAAQVGACRSNVACLSTYSQNTPSMAAVAGRCDAYAGSASESAASIITKVGAACGISQKALLVLLEKEQGLVSSSNPSQYAFNAATGMGCPDTAGCDPNYGGFFYQVYYAARQFKAYAASPNSWTHIAGRVNNIRFSPNADCGTSPVYIENQATAGLYNYTPYQPNAAAMANLYGTGDACSAYGNRNFWRIYTDWFGTPAAVNNPTGSYDSFAITSTSATGAKLAVAGWTFDATSPSTSIPADVYVTYPNGAVIGTRLVANGARSDVAAAYPGAGPNHGFGMSIDVAAGGTYQACVYGIGRLNDRFFDCKSVTIPQTSPTTNLDRISITGQGATTAISVGGWAFDSGAPSTSIPVHVYVTSSTGISNRYVLAANLGRPDVAAAFPGLALGPNHGFVTSIPVITGGTYTVCAYAIATYWANKDLNPLIGSCKTLNLISAFPVASYDTLTVDRSGSQAKLNLSGWTFDRGSPDTSIPVHFYVTDPTGKVSLVRAVADKPRADVNAVYGTTGNHGFAESLIAPTAGTYQICAYGLAVSPMSVNMNTAMGCRSVTLVARAPTGVLDSASIATQSGGGKVLNVSGWAFDSQVPTRSIGVHVYVTAADGSLQFFGVFTGGPRPDVAAAYPGIGANTGYTGSVAVTKPGNYTVCTYGIGTAALNIGLNSQLGCKVVSNN